MSLLSPCTCTYKYVLVLSSCVVCVVCVVLRCRFVIVLVSSLSSTLFTLSHSQCSCVVFVGAVVLRCLHNIVPVVVYVVYVLLRWRLVIVLASCLPSTLFLAFAWSLFLCRLYRLRWFTLSPSYFLCVVLSSTWFYAVAKSLLLRGLYRLRCLRCRQIIICAWSLWSTLFCGVALSLFLDLIYQMSQMRLFYL
jgi:hypothetical protein